MVRAKSQRDQDEVRQPESIDCVRRAIGFNIQKTKAGLVL